jgi:polyisoprenoid-binding protein YceI
VHRPARPHSARSTARAAPAAPTAAAAATAAPARASRRRFTVEPRGLARLTGALQRGHGPILCD